MRWTVEQFNEYQARRAQAGTKLPAAKLECDQAPALESSSIGETQSDRLPTVRFIFYRQRLFDLDNAYASAKDLLDGLSSANLIQGDAPTQIRLQVEQVKVAHRSEQKTVIVIEYP